MDESPESAEEYFKRSLKCQFSYFKKLIEKIPFKNTDHVFELGCGTGAMSAHLAREFVPKGKVTGCDPEGSRIRFAEDKFAETTNLNFMQATGAVALRNKENVYDVVVSNAVLHWINENELDETVENMFVSMKPGGTAAHNFIEDIPDTFKVLGKLDEGKLSKFLDTLHLIKCEKFEALAKKVGFIVVDSCKVDHVTELETEDELVTFLDASTFGLFGWKKLFNDAKEKGTNVNFAKSDLGMIKHVSGLVQFILKKP